MLVDEMTRWQDGSQASEDRVPQPTENQSQVGSPFIWCGVKSPASVSSSSFNTEDHQTE